MKVQFRPNGIATGIGSLPLTDPEEAVSTQEKHQAALQPRLSGSGHNTSETNVGEFRGFRSERTIHRP